MEQKFRDFSSIFPVKFSIKNREIEQKFRDFFFSPNFLKSVNCKSIKKIREIEQKLYDLFRDPPEASHKPPKEASVQVFY